MDVFRQLTGRQSATFTAVSPRYLTHFFDYESTWLNIDYQFVKYKSELAAYYRDAFIAMVTPLRDGMNLVAKEFVACQIEEPGVLILSPFAGAGETMQEALLINPYKIDDVAELICSALEMSRDEREVRMKNLRRREKWSY